MAIGRKQKVPVEMPCDFCGGSGTCPSCNGSGQMRRPISHLIGLRFVLGQYNMTNCAGCNQKLSATLGDGKCPGCKGEGTVTHLVKQRV